MPDQVVDDKKIIKLGGTTLELDYVGRNHSDNSLVMRLPKEKIIFVVDFAPIEAVQFRNMPDNASPLEYIDSLKKLASLDWDRMIPGHPYAGGRLGTKKDVEDDIAYMEDLSAEVKKAADAGKCFDTAMKEVKLPKYEKWANYESEPARQCRALLLLVGPGVLRGTGRDGDIMPLFCPTGQMKFANSEYHLRRRSSH